MLLRTPLPFSAFQDLRTSSNRRSLKAGVVELASIFVAACLYLIPAAINGMPILYPDTVGYYHTGESALSLVPDMLNLPSSENKERSAETAKRASDGVSTARSVFYGAPLVVLHRAGGTWLVAFAQCLLTVLALSMLLRTFKLENPYIRFTIFIAAGLAGAATFASTLLPDFLAALAVLAGAIILVRWPELRFPERMLWLVLMMFGALAHKSILAVLVLVCGARAINLALRRDELKSAIVLGGALAVVTAGHFMVSLAVQKVSGRPPLDPPFLLARTVGDGTIRPYLDRHCSRESWALCPYRYQMPMSENDFLWGRNPGRTVYAKASSDEKQQILAQANELALRAILAQPIQQAGRSLVNVAKQFVVAGVDEYQVVPSAPAVDDSGLRSDLLSYEEHSGISRGTMPLHTISLVIKIFYVMGAIGLFAFITRTSKTERRASWGLVLMVVLGLGANALVHGAFAGVFDRYQGRLTWLIPVLATCLLLRLDAERRSAVTVAPVTIS